MGAHRCVFYFELSNPLPKVNDISFFRCECIDINAQAV